MTSASARIIAESTDPYTTKRPCHLAYHASNRARGKYSLQMKIRIRYECHVGDWFEYLKVSTDEMAEVVAGSGWTVTDFIPEDSDDIYLGVIEKEQK